MPPPAAAPGRPPGRAPHCLRQGPAVPRRWLIRFLEHRIGDERIIRLVRKWLKAGVLEMGQWQSSDMGTPQGAVISPLLANIYLAQPYTCSAPTLRCRFGSDSTH